MSSSVSRYWRVMSSFFALNSETVSFTKALENGLAHTIIEAARKKYGVDGETLAEKYRLKNGINEGEGYPMKFEP
ncbi:MAG: hypothetical protein WAV40_03130 [Microgenomates group bacterium]